VTDIQEEINETEETPSTKPGKAERQGRLKAAKKYIERAIKNNLPMPRQMMHLELKATRKRLLKENLTPADAWYIYTCPDPVDWTAHWFRLSAGAVRELQRNPNEGKRWTAAELAELGPGLRSPGKALKKDE
jgi:hypothetical protein